MRRTQLTWLALVAAALTACGDSQQPSNEPQAAAPFNLPTKGRVPVDPSILPIIRTASVQVDNPTYDFQIDFRYITPVTDAQRAVFENARDRWQNIIVNDVPDITGTIPAGSCLGGLPNFTGTIDDILIDVILQNIDGPGNILGSAGPCFVRNADNLTVHGIMFFDTSDLAFLESLGLFDEVITHEMGHVLGYGTLWNFRRALRTGTGTANPLFVGPEAQVHFNPAPDFVSQPVPVENTGGPGTANAHWRESVFQNELMTGFLNLGENPLSLVTTASMSDLGYGVFVWAADFWCPPWWNTPLLMNAMRSLEGEGGGTQGLDIDAGEALLFPRGVIE